MKRILVTFNDEQYAILQGMTQFGNTDAERLRNVFLAYASENDFLRPKSKK